MKTTLSSVQVFKRNRRGTPAVIERSARGRHGRVHFEGHHGHRAEGTPGPGWKQPGRRFGPTPLGPDVPKENKGVDGGGNPRILPLRADQRLARYYAGPGKRYSRMPEPDDDGAVIDRSELTGRERAALLGLTTRQRRRLTHKANRALRNPR